MTTSSVVLSDDNRLMLQYVSAAQAVLAVFAAPEGPQDGGQVLKILTDLFEDPKLLAAQMRLMDRPDKIFVILEQGGSPSII